MATPEEREKESRESPETKYEELRDEEEAARHERVQELGEKIAELKERAED